MKAIKGYEGRYTISQLGEVWDHKRKKALTQKGKGFLSVKFGGITHLVHRLVAEAFLINPERYTNIIHKNGNIQDNDLYNLQWVKQI